MPYPRLSRDVKAYLLRILIAFDGLCQAFFRFGTIGVTISARAATARHRGHRWGCWMCDYFLDRIQANHCELARLGDMRRAKAAIDELTED